MRRALMLGFIGAVLAVAGLGVRVARAGTITAYANSSNCGLLSAYTNTYDLALSNWTTGCNLLEISNVNETLYPENYFGQLITYAPAGIAITSAAVSGASADGGPTGSHWWTGSVWSGGSNTWAPGYDGVDQFPGGSSYWGMQMWCVATDWGKAICTPRRSH